ncbi:hypothetical protein NW768_010825 [Fusarium equiseti]|uniref:Fungal N-terminal domain-containing protein n=1 Tax=Fusarium equiseti TaxID=61235 RepID=A0ABQ8QZJ5_FUSEQ|nr:hypothetical protein NW768_010825 [Fusarium equiseti]
MDGLSIATACFAFIEIADKAFKTISDFVKDCKDARNDLESVSQELVILKRTLNLLKGLVAQGGDSDLTSNTKKDIREIIRNSLGVTETLEDELRGQEGKYLAINWATKGKKKVATYRVILETNRRAISLAVETITLATAKNIKRDTTEILDDTTHMKGDLSRIISRIQNLEALVTRQEEGDPHAFMLKRYLNELSSVADSVCDPSSRPASPEPNQSSASPRSISSSSASDDTSDAEGSDPEHMESTLDRVSELVAETKKPERVSLESETSQTSLPARMLLTSDDKAEALDCQSESSNTASTPPMAPELKNPDSSVEDVETTARSVSSKTQRVAFQLRQSQFLPWRLQILEDAYPTALSFGGERLLWKQSGSNPDDIYDIQSKCTSEAMTLKRVDKLRHTIYKKEMRVLSTDASLILFKTSKSCWKVYDRLTGKTIKQDFPNSLSTWTQQILPISKDCSLVLMGHYRKGFTINRIRRTLSTTGRKDLVWNYAVLPSSRESAPHHVRISRDGENIIGVLGDTQQLCICIWKPTSDWFTEDAVASFQDIRNPLILNLQQEDLNHHERVIGLTSTKGTLSVVKGISSTRNKHHAGFRNIGFRVTSFGLVSGAIILSNCFSASDIHGGDSKESFFTDAKMSIDGEFLRTRIAKIPEVGKRRTAWTGMETLVVRIHGLEIVHRFKEVWNADFTEPLTLSVFAPNFDVLARFSWKKKREDQSPRMWLEVYELEKVPGDKETACEA